MLRSGSVKKNLLVTNGYITTMWYLRGSKNPVLPTRTFAKSSTRAGVTFVPTATPTPHHHQQSLCFHSSDCTVSKYTLSLHAHGPWRVFGENGCHIRLAGGREGDWERERGRELKKDIDPIK